MEKNYIRQNINNINYQENKFEIDRIILETIKNIITGKEKNIILNYFELQKELELFIKCVLLKKLDALGGNIEIETESFSKEMIRQIITFYLSKDKVIRRRKGVYIHNKKIVISQANFNDVFYKENKEEILIELLKTIYHEVEHHKQIGLKLYDNENKKEIIENNIRFASHSSYNDLYAEIEIDANIKAYKEILKDNYPFIKNYQYIENKINYYEHLREKEEYNKTNLELPKQYTLKK